MAIPCPRCGREYDVTLFQFGRTIHCTCGSRVGLEKRLAAEPTSRRPRFYVDAMLGRLARWLRVLGYDTAFDAAVQDADLVRQALSEGRVILTRDRGLPQEWRVENFLVLEEEELPAQLKRVIRQFGLDREELFTRCVACNGMLTPAEPQDVTTDVPSRILLKHDRFTRCRHCGRVFWEGSHARRIRTRLSSLFDEGGEG